MEDLSMDELLNWGTGELTEFPDFDFFDSVISLDNQSQFLEDVPELTPDHQPAAQDTIDAINAMNRLVGELSSRVTALEDQLQSEHRKREALEHYIEELQAFLGQFSFAVQK
ncbi:hypothetical protein EYZ11_008375 [Aspergillus tanneri]|nr:hypothetical protein EYZ11_008375 [Aspergillus tanneri]